MRWDAAADVVDGIIPVAFSFIALLLVSISALVYCAAGKNTSAGQANPSEKSKSVTKSMMSSVTNGPVPTGGTAKEDNRVNWAATLVETQNPRLVYQEFLEHLKEYKATDRTSISFEANLNKNRYHDMMTYDQDRVILKGPSGDYINANYMNAPDGVKYIATQGPLSETRTDFWQMVVQEEAQIVLQLCKFVEGDNEKCAEYWPYGENNTTTVLDRFTIRKIDKPEEIVPGTVKTKLRIESKVVNRTIQHIMCDSWPDQLAPSDPATIIKIWNYVKANRGAGPIIVHCSAGVGRTATFIGLSYGVEILKKPGTTTADIVKELRKCRPKAVQTHIQYGFLHACLLEQFMQMNVVPRNPQATAFLEAFRKTVDRKMEKKADRSNSAEMQSSNGYK